MQVISACRCRPVQDRPSKWPKPEFLLELLMPLLADPARLDRGGKRPQGDARRQVREVVFALAARAPLAHQPDLLAGQVAVVRPDSPSPTRMRVAANRAARGPLVPCRQVTLRHARSASTASASRGSWSGTGRRLRPLGRDQLDVRAIDLLVARDADRPGQAALAQAVAEGGARAVAGVGQHDAEPHARHRRAGPTRPARSRPCCGPPSRRPARRPRRSAPDRRSIPRAGTAATPRGPAPLARPASARPAPGSSPACPAGRSIAAPRRPRACPSSAAPCRRSPDAACGPPTSRSGLLGQHPP